MKNFHVIDGGCLSYHVLFGRPWIRQHKAGPSTYYQCVKVFWKGRKIYICATDSPFQQDETHFS